ncbi:MAG: GntR family transcriptional regulator [Acidimicrobiia bacterium]|nr:GntR family transcriptional regulator [Acidimicrobiia bacterium]
MATPGTTPLRPLEAKSIEEAVTDALREAILSGDLGPGQRLAQVELSEALGVSRIPLRDALRRLEAEGLVEIRGRAGAHVSSLDARDLAEVYDMRILLEPECARLAVDALPDDAIGRLLDLSVEMDATARDPIRGSRARTAFYAELYSFADRPRMRATILELRALVHVHHRIAGNHDHGHDELRACITTRDGAAAAEFTRRHLVEARNDLLGRG